MKRIILLTWFLIFSAVVFTQSIIPQQEFEKNGEIYFSITTDQSKDIADLSRIISIDNRQGNTLYAYASQEEWDHFLETGLPYHLLPHPNSHFNPIMKTWEEYESNRAFNAYPTYEAYVNLMYQFESNFPEICDVYSIGQSVQGRELLVARISDNMGIDENEPEFFYTSTMHGDETAGYIFMLNLIDTLLNSYGTSERITNLVNEIDIFINPLANPDGTYYGGNNSVSSARRYNANNYDLNRNFPDVVNGYHNNTQPETYRFVDFAVSRSLNLSSNLHGGAEVCNYPWDHKYALCADDAWWQFVCREYADTAHAHAPPWYMDGFDNGITNGADWYVIDHGRQDYTNFYTHGREFTLELSNTKLLPESQLEQYWNYNSRSFLNYLEQSLYGVRGIVSDAVSGLPIEAKVYVLNHEIDIDASWVYSSLPAGNYHRYLISGTYDLKFSAPCYEDFIVNDVNIVNWNTTILNVQLTPLSDAVDFIADQTNIPVGTIVQFTDLSCGNPTSWSWTFNGPGTPVFVNGSNSNSQNPEVRFDDAGVYDVSLTVTTTNGSGNETKYNYISVSDCIYCPSTYSDDDDDFITNVTFNTINNNSGQGGADSYEDFTYISTQVEPGNTYPISITFEMNGNWHQDCYAFIDWNQNCVLDDSGESYNLGYQQGSGTLSSTITIPSDVENGNYLFRIVEQYNQDPGPCNPHETVYGETEDYTIVINTGLAGLWTGAVSNDWDTPANWDDGAVPVGNIDVIIPATAVNWPVKTGSVILGTHCYSIYLSDNSSLAITGNLDIPAGYDISSENSVLEMGGDFNSDGTFNAGTGTVIFTGNIDQHISASSSATFYDVLIDKDASSLHLDCDVILNHNLTVLPNAWLTNASENNLLVYGDFTLQNSSTEKASFIDHGTTTVLGNETIVMPYLQNRWYNVSSAFMNSLSGIFLDLYLYTYLENTDDWYNIFETNYWLAPGNGYLLWNETDIPSITYEGGGLNTGNVSPSLSITDRNFNGLADEDEGWNLVGNPYSSAIDITSEALTWSENISGSIYLHNGTQYATFNRFTGVGTLSANQYIPSLQGFFIKVTDLTPSPVLTFNQGAQLHHTQINYKTSNQQGFIRLVCSGNQIVDELIFHTFPGSTNNYDPEFDALKLNSDDIAVGFYTQVENIKMQVNAVEQFDSEEKFPVYLKPSTEDIFTISFSEIQLDQNLNCYLTDLLTNQKIMINQDLEYTFMANPENDPHRFNIHFLEPGIDELPESGSIRIWNYGKSLIIQQNYNEHIWFSINDLSGKHILSSSFTSNLFTFDLSEPGVYLIHGFGEAEAFSQKILIP